MDQDAPSSPDQDKAPEQASGLAKFWAELKRRKVVRVAVTYAIVGWLIIQIANATFGEFGIPIWAYRFVVLMVLLGFPLALILAWAFELTPEGIKTTKHAVKARGSTVYSEQQQKKRNWMAYATGAIIPSVIFGVLALIFFLRERTEDSVAAQAVQLEVEYDKSIAVLPFTNMSANDEHAYFADGVHETILTNLANLGDLRVVSRTSVIQYRDTEKPIPTIGQELNVAYILEGSMQRAGNQFKLTAQLIEARQDNHLWAKDFTGELTDIFKVQAELAGEIAGALQAVLSPQEQQQLQRPRTASIEAYDAYLQALESYNSGGSRDDLSEALLKVVDLDPTFTDAWLRFAYNNGVIYLNGGNRTPEYEREIKYAIDMASNLEPDNPKVLLGLARYYYQCHLDFSRARFYINQIAERLPNSSEVQFLLGSINRREGNWAENITYFKRALLLDPNNNNIINNLAGSYSAIRDWKSAAEYWDKLKLNTPIDSIYQYFSARGRFRSDGSMKELSEVFATEHNRIALEEYYHSWLYDAGDLKAFTKDEVVNAWEDRPPPHRGMGRYFSSSHQVIVLTILGELNKRDAHLELIFKNAEERIKASTEDFTAQLQLGLAHALKGNHDEAQRAIDLAIAIRPESADAFRGSALAAERAMVMACMGKKDEAVAELTRLSKKPNYHINYHSLKNSLRYWPLRDHSGFQALLNDPALKLPIPIER